MIREQSLPCFHEQLIQDAKKPQLGSGCIVKSALHEYRLA
jgi:hypothetical protein